MRAMIATRLLSSQEAMHRRWTYCVKCILLPAIYTAVIVCLLCLILEQEAAAITPLGLRLI